MSEAAMTEYYGHCPKCGTQLGFGHEPDKCSGVVESAISAQMSERFTMLRIAEWATALEISSGDIIVRFKRDRACMDGKGGFLEHPETFCEIEPSASRRMKQK